MISDGDDGEEDSEENVSRHLESFIIHQQDEAKPALRTNAPRDGDFK